MPDFSSLTARQKEIYEFIRQKIEQRGYPPTVREIGIHFDIKSPNGVMCHLKALVKKGLINRVGKEARAMQLSDYQPPSAGIPLLGPVAAGTPIEAIPNEERINLNELFNRPDYFALEVRGESMIEDHIQDGDWVVVRKQETAGNGSCVAIQINDEITLKRFYLDNDLIRLEPANSTMEPIIVPASEGRILGVLVGVIRKC